ncbi:MAG: hypothetical protein BMS9Abin20_1164 [Acidimicrobiia bacterium]|nr:MAG: hypothetical protein BMS9Abin20_1164 [Acidimicrobiia bacterium]
MPRPDKIYKPSPRREQSTPSRGTSWSKYGSIETADHHDGIPTEITVVLESTTDVETEEMPGRPETSENGTRPSSASLPPIPGDLHAAPRLSGTVKTPEWVSERTIDGRTYRRRDELITIESRI